MNNLITKKELKKKLKREWKVIWENLEYVIDETPENSKDLLEQIQNKYSTEIISVIVVYLKQYKESQLQKEESIQEVI